MFRVLICFKRWIMSAYLYAYCIQLKWGCQELLHWSYSRLCQTAIFDCQIPQFSLRQPQANKLSWLFAIFDCQIRQFSLRQLQANKLSWLFAIFDLSDSAINFAAIANKQSFFASCHFWLSDKAIQFFKQTLLAFCNFWLSDTAIQFTSISSSNLSWIYATFESQIWQFSWQLPQTAISLGLWNMDS